MRAPLIGWRPQAGSPIVEARMSVDMIDAERLKALVVYGPVARMNPYQALLYGKFAEAGIATSELIPLADYGKLAVLKSFAPNVALHIHWPGSLLQSAKSEYEGEKLVEQVSSNLDALQDAGIQLVYTIHNMVSHDAALPKAEYALQNLILSRADVLHTMTEPGMRRIRENYEVGDATVIEVAHPTYRGVYPDYFSKAECRRFLGIGVDDPVVALFGAIKPYKGLKQVMDTWRRMEKRGSKPPYLLVAGKPDGSKEAKLFVKWAESNPRVIVYPVKVPFEQVQIFAKAADYGLVPYERSLNSGAAMLFATFRRPVIGIDEPSVYAGFPDGAYQAFDGQEDFQAFMEALARPNGEMLRREVVWDPFLEDRDPAQVSARFAEQLGAALSSRTKARR